ncbi:MAG: iron ABC transporter permease [Pseudomonadota bacterium]
MRGLIERASALWTLPALAVALALAVPLVAILATLLTPAGATTAHLQATVLPDYILNSVLLMLLTGALALLFGTATAWLTAACTFPGARWLSGLLVLPLAAPAYVVAYAYTDLLEVSGPLQTALRGLLDVTPAEFRLPSIRNIPGAATLLALVLYPYVYLLTRTSFAARSRAHFEAARVLGLSAWQAFWRVGLPGARPAIAGGVALVMMETLADFGVVEYFSVPTFSTGIYRTWIGLGDKAAALRLAAIMLLFVIALVMLESVSRRGGIDRDDVSRAQAIELRGWRAVAAFVICAVPVTLGFIIPVALLTVYTLGAGDTVLMRGFGQYVSNSVTVASAAAVLAVALAVLLSYAQRLHTSRVNSGFVRIATLGYALPGLLLAVALLEPVNRFDQWLSGLGSGGGSVLAGTVFVLIYAYLCRFLTVAFQSTSAGLARVSPDLDAAARSLGATPGGVIRRVHLPLLAPSLAAGLLLVFVDVMRELPATLLLRPFNFDTLATRVYRLASDERLQEASPAALAIVLVGVIPVLIINWTAARRDRRRSNDVTTEVPQHG